MQKMKTSIKRILKKTYALVGILILIGVWQLVCALDLVPGFMLPSPVEVAKALAEDFALLMQHTKTTLTEALLGLAIGVATGFILAVMMDSFKLLKKITYPLLVISQTIPTVAIAPLLVLWFGYEMLPKVILIVLTTFFPIAIGLFEGFSSCDRDCINLLRSMGASKIQIFGYVKIPGAITPFFSALKISASYSIVGAVISEWLGGFEGLGVYMTRVKKAYQYDKMFAVIILISLLSLILMGIISFAHKKLTPWEQITKKGED